jgi:phage terminase large subunit GpA-like protein
MSLADLRRDIAEMIRRTCPPVDTRTVTQWADACRKLPETSTSPGDYDSSVTPYARRPMDLTGDPSTVRITLCWGTQTTKALAIDTPIATPTGWSTMGELRVGDQVFGADGAVVEVVAATPVAHGRPTYRLHFDDGTSIVADAEHLWCLSSHRSASGWRAPLRTTDLLRVRRERRRIPVAGVLQIPPSQAALPLPPYVLGAWLGDGNTDSPAITADVRDGVLDEVLREWPTAEVSVRPGFMRTILLSPRLPAQSTCARGHEKTLSGGEMQCFTCSNLRQIAKRRGEPFPRVPRGNVAGKALRALGVLGNKHIPLSYLRADTASRWALLQGLMDTDGCATTKGQCSLVSVKEPLARSVVELVRSLGLKPALRVRRAMLKGVDCGPVWQVSFTAYRDQPVFRLERKQSRLKDAGSHATRPTEARNRGIVRIEPEPSVPVRCIQVSAPDGLFLAGEAMVPTHNSTVIENVIANRIVRAPTPMIIVQPKIDSAEAMAKERIVPMILATPELRSRVRLGKASDSSLRFKRFPGGFLFIASARSGPELASRSAPFIANDEIDEFDDIPGQGNPIEIVRRRQGAAEIGLEINTSTPRDAATSRIWPELEAGTNERYHVPCPHCETPQELRFGGRDQPFGLKWPSGRPHLAEYLCEHCQVMIAPSKKSRMLALGDWVATNPEAPPGVYSFHLSSLYSPFGKSNWGVIADEFVRAASKPADLQVFVNTRLAELFVDHGDGEQVEGLMQRLETWPEGTVPDGVGLLTAGMDVQDNRIEVYVWGWGAGRESWPIYWTLFVGDTGADPTLPNSPWRAADAWVAQARFRHQVSGALVPVSAIALDTGYQTATAYRFANQWRRFGCIATKGIGGQGVPMLGKPTLQGDMRVPLFPIGVHQAKTEWFKSDLPTPANPDRAPTPGLVHLPDWFTTDQLQQLVSEKLTSRLSGGRVVREWIKKRKDLPNEGLDCRLGARVALEHLGIKVIAELGVRAEKLRTATPDTSSPAAPARTTRTIIGGLTP